MAVYAIIPAHNEQGGIFATVESLLSQSYRPQRVIVSADNCTDSTAHVAVSSGAEVFETVGNTHKKAGALNQAFNAYKSVLSDDDYVILMDADSVLDNDFIENAMNLFAREENIGGLSGAIVARDQSNMIEVAQAMEYARGTRQMSRSNGFVHVLSGAASIFPVRVLREVQAARGTLLPGTSGDVFIPDSMTEDYELTLALRKLGYVCRSTKKCRVTTDLMPSWSDLSKQRVRWYRGAMESTAMYGFNRLTWKIWASVIFTYLQSLMLPIVFCLMTFAYFTTGIHFSPWSLVILPLFVAEAVVVAKRVNTRAIFLALAYFPLWIYDNILYSYCWKALYQIVMKSNRIWVT